MHHTQLRHGAIILYERYRHEPETHIDKLQIGLNMARLSALRQR